MKRIKVAAMFAVLFGIVAVSGAVTIIASASSALASGTP
jgi:hypothetical protein